MIKIESTTEQKMYFKGTMVEIAEAFARLQFFAPPSGKSIEVAFDVFESVAAYESGAAAISVDGLSINSQSYDLALGTDPETYAAQSNLVAHEKVKGYLDGLGFTTTIIGL